MPPSFLLLIHCLHAAQGWHSGITRCSRRMALATTAAGTACFLPTGTDNAVHAEDATATFTKMDAFQLKASCNGLDDALQSWGVELAQIQLGNEANSVVAVAGLGDGTLQHFSESGSASSVDAFEKSRSKLLQLLYLARGAVRYENDAKVAQDYIAKAKVEAEAARGSLGDIAATLGIELTRRPQPSGPPAEERITFQPRVREQSSANRLVF